MLKKSTTAYRSLRRTVNFMLSILVKVKVTGYENFDKNQQYIVVCNHTSWLDTPIVISKLPKTFHMVLLAEAAGTLDGKLAKKIIEKGQLNIVEVNRADKKSRLKGLRVTLKKAKEGYTIVIFPEGRINPDNSKLYPFYTGVFFIAVKSQIPILPMYIRGTEKIYFRRRINVNFGTPISVEKGETEKDLAIKTYKHLLENVQPKAPINKRKKVKKDFTTAFVGKISPRFEGADEMIADTLGMDDTFAALNSEFPA
ncbi:MAG: lysophospholipid acyltransferase family protein [Eubacteriales bacterium]